MTLAERLKEGLETNIVFSVFGIDIDEATVVTWIIMAIIVILCIVLTWNLKLKNISKRQAAAEFIVTKLDALAHDMLGEHGAKYAIYLVSVLLYLGFANVIDVLGFKPPTKTLNVTASLALMSIILVQYAGIRARGLKGWLRAFKQPMALVTPFNILDLFTRPLSLCMRLFGNVLGAFIIMEILKHVVPIIIPAAFSL
jgi:F-type H+-transporting ATPase subunit a